MNRATAGLQVVLERIHASRFCRGGRHVQENVRDALLSGCADANSVREERSADREVGVDAALQVRRVAGAGARAGLVDGGNGMVQGTARLPAAKLNEAAPSCSPLRDTAVLQRPALTCQRKPAPPSPAAIDAQAANATPARQDQSAQGQFKSAQKSRSPAVARKRRNRGLNAGKARI